MCIDVSGLGMYEKMETQAVKSTVEEYYTAFW